MANSIKQKEVISKLDDIAFESLVEKKRYQTLKTLLFDAEQQRIQRIESYLNDPELYAGKIAESLPSAIKLTDTDKFNAAMHGALNYSIQSSVLETIQKEPELYADILYPVIFPAIKKSIAEAFKEMMQSLNYAIEQGLSINRFAWHYEAWRSGVPYREVVLRHTLAYRVEQAFLIHRESGLLLHHVTSSDIHIQRDGDAISAMLTAIQDFTKDSFAVNSDDYLDMVEIGDYTVFLNRGPYAVLACVIQGIAPYTLKEKFEAVLYQIHRQYSNLLKNFNGDSSSLAVVESDLKSCLIVERKQKEKSKYSQWYFLIPTLLIGVSVGYWYYNDWQFKNRAESYLQVLQQGNPSIVITEYQRSHDQLRIKGMYDPMLIHPNILIHRSKLQQQEVKGSWLAYQSLEPSVIKQRLMNILKPPKTITMQLMNKGLVIKGVAEQTWINKFNSLIPFVNGIDNVVQDDLQTYQQYLEKQLQPPKTVQLYFADGQLQVQGSASILWKENITEKIATIDWIKKSYQMDQLIIIEETQLNALNDQLAKQAIYFSLSSAELTEDEEKWLQEIVALFKNMQSLSQKLHKTMSLQVIGFTDGIGNNQTNQKLAQQRAEIVSKKLQQYGITMDIETALQLEKQKGAPLRKVSFSAVFK